MNDLTESYLEDNFDYYTSKMEGGGIFDFFKKGYENVKNYFNPYKDLRPIAKKYINDYGDWKVFKIQAFRKPIQSMIEKLLNLISNNRFNEGKKIANYDELYHLGLIFTLGNFKGQFVNILVEKNERIDMDKIPLTLGNSYGELMSIPVNKEIRFKEIIENARKGMGDIKFLEYDPFTSNCQMFAKGLLEYSGLLTPEAEKFIYQPIEQIVDKIPKSTPIIARGITQLGAFFANIGSKITGRGDGYALHAVIVHKPVSMSHLQELQQEFVGDKTFIRETKNSYRIRNIPKQRFEKGSFRSKKIKDKDITLVFGKLKVNGGAVPKNLSEIMKSQVPEKIKEAYDFISKLPKIPSGKKPISANTKEERKKLREQWEEENRPEMLKILHMTKDERANYKKEKQDEYNAYISSPEAKKKKEEEQKEYGVRAVKMIEKAKKYNTIKNLISDLEKKKKDLKSFVNKYTDKKYVKQVIDDYNKDMDALSKYDFYAIKNTILRDQLDKQYLKMWDLMNKEPKKYGYLPSNKEDLSKADPKYIKFVYDNFGKAPPDFLMNVADFLEDFVSEIPGVGQIYDVVGRPIIQELKTDKLEEVSPVDFEKGYEEFQQLEENVSKAQQQIPEIEGLEKGIEAEQQQLAEQQRQIVGTGAFYDFRKMLKKLGITQKKYLQIMQKIAKNAGYNKPLKISKDGTHKLEYDGVKFGKSDYMDYILYMLSEGKETAKKHRKNYLKRTAKMKGNWKNNPLSANNLARIIIWDEKNILKV